MENVERSLHTRSVLLIINPRARNGESAFLAMKKELELGGYHIIECRADERSSDPNILIHKYQQQISFVMIGGGDGSVNLALPSLLATQIPLIVYPLGTANNLARSFNLPTDPKQIVAMLEHAGTVQVDIGLVNEIPFVNVAGLGLSTMVNQTVTPVLKKKLGVLAFILTALKVAPRMNPFRATITQGNSMIINSHTWQITVCNGKYYGAGMAIKHDASLFDEKLHCLSTEVSEWWQAFTLIPAFISGRYKKKHDVTILSDREFKIETRRRFAIDVDGDIKTSTPAVFKIAPKALNLLVPGF
jgi:diacylglycerol kinase (ATP)